MATWIVHLRIAEKILQMLPILEATSFAVGSIAPDSGLPDEKWEKFDPPAWITHFGVQSSPDQKLGDLEFYRQYLLPLRAETRHDHFAFRLGYFFHLITDNLWGWQIGWPTRERFSSEFEADRRFIWEVKKDWFCLDFLYVHTHPDCLFWDVFLDAWPENGNMPFLPLEAVGQRIAYIQEYYQGTGSELQTAYNRPYIYLSKGEMDHFMDDATGQLLRIYQQLWIDGIDTGGLLTALELEHQGGLNG